MLPHGPLHRRWTGDRHRDRGRGSSLVAADMTVWRVMVVAWLVVAALIGDQPGDFSGGADV